MDVAKDACIDVYIIHVHVHISVHVYILEKPVPGMHRNRSVFQHHQNIIQRNNEGNQGTAANSAINQSKVKVK